MPTQEARTRIYESDSPEWKKAYYEKNKDIIAKRNKEKLMCDCCGKEISRGQMTKHKATPYCRKRRITSTANDKELQLLLAELHNATIDMKYVTSEMKTTQDKYNQVRAKLDTYLNAPN
jgi:late competence protein required for DNA uptake (superfamily II DNA/RNA helicase)